MCQGCDDDSSFNFFLPDPDPNILRVIAIPQGLRRNIGRPPLVENFIQTQYRTRFAQVYEWSPRQTTPNSDEVISLLNKRIILSP